LQRAISLILLLNLNGCALPLALSSLGGYVGGGGLALYKSEKSTGPKAEFVLIKVEIHHDIITTPK